MATINPLNDVDFDGYMIPTHALFLSMALHYMQPWTEIFTVTSRIVLYFVMPLAWVMAQSRKAATWLLYFMLMLPWMIKCTTESVPSIDIYCTLSAMMSILPTYLFILQRIFCRARFSTCWEKICSCLLVVCGILLASLYTMEKHQIHAIQKSAPFVGVWEAFGLDVAKRMIQDGTYTYVQKAIYIFFEVIVFPLTTHLYLVLILLLIRMIFT
ncbi:Hypothetical protein GLP15_93 [Giardia lamblia P15]|uniref:Uncharacterized protein n=1 Tax=Giardia intestinalis (strain P15) TaxID=658858 RepID=E1F8H2_GIAIA|nr:Hypothetical protein GLP15_93 [Giardia lamblia P15]